MIPDPHDEACYMINGNKYEPAQSTKRKWEDKTERLRDKDGKLLNRTGPYGKPMVCFKCDSEYHFSNRSAKKNEIVPQWESHKKRKRKRHRKQRVSSTRHVL